MRVSIWIKKRNIKTLTNYHQISEKMGIIVNLEKSRDQKFQSKMIFSLLKLNLSFILDQTAINQNAKTKRDKEELPKWE